MRRARRLVPGLTMLLGAALIGAGCSTPGAGPLTPHDAGGLHYADTGPVTGSSGALVFVHGWACDHTVWRDQLDALRSRGWRIMAIDLPGHGLSEPADAPHTMDLYADAIARMMDDAGVRRAVLVGHSNGTPTIRQFFRRHPDRTLALVTVDGALLPMVPPEQARGILEMLRSDSYRDVVAGFVDAMAPPDWPDANRRLVQAMIDRASQEAIVGGLEAAIDESIWEQDPITVPVLMINAASPFWTDEYLAEVRTFVPDLEYHQWPGVTHFLMLDRPGGFNATLTSFVKRRELLE